MLPPPWFSFELRGRSRRAECCWLTLFWAVVAGATVTIDLMLLGATMLVGFLNGRLLLAFVPHLAVSMHSLHDQDMSGLWYLVSLLPTIGTLINI